jgi:glycosyltransferase involved in cell wall biosynthesis
MKPAISIVMPAFNEAANVAEAVHEAAEVLRELTDRPEILVVDDGSTDDTGRILGELELGFPELRVIRHATNLGVARALDRLYREATGDLVFFNSADRQAPMRYLAELLPALEYADLVVGWYPQRQDPVARRLLSRGYHFFARVLLGIRLHNVNALKLFRRTVYDPSYPWTASMCFDAEFVAAAQRRGFRVVDVPLEHFARAGGKSHVASLGTIVQTLAALVQVRRSLRRHL